MYINSKMIRRESQQITAITIFVNHCARRISFRNGLTERRRVVDEGFRARNNVRKHHCRPHHQKQYATFVTPNRGKIQVRQVQQPKDNRETQYPFIHKFYTL